MHTHTHTKREKISFLNELHATLRKLPKCSTLQTQKKYQDHCNQFSFKSTQEHWRMTSLKSSEQRKLKCINLCHSYCKASGAMHFASHPKINGLWFLVWELTNDSSKAKRIRNFRRVKDFFELTRIAISWRAGHKGFPDTKWATTRSWFEDVSPVSETPFQLRASNGITWH